MRTLFLFFLVTLICLPVCAGEWSIIGSAEFIDKTGNDQFEEQLERGSADFDFDSSAGLGAGILWEEGQWGLEVKASFTRTDITVKSVLSDAVFLLDLGTVDVIPVTALIQYRFHNSGDMTPYIGAGAALIHLSSIQVPESDEKIEFDDDYGFVVNAGFDVELSRQWALNLDGRYIPLETASSGEASVFGRNEIRLEPLIWSAGLRYRF